MRLGFGLALLPYLHGRGGAAGSDGRRGTPPGGSERGARVRVRVRVRVRRVRVRVGGRGRGRGRGRNSAWRHAARGRPSASRSRRSVTFRG